jgi:serine/threonine protein kinase
MGTYYVEDESLSKVGPYKVTGVIRSNPNCHVLAATDSKGNNVQIDMYKKEFSSVTSIIDGENAAAQQIMREVLIGPKAASISPDGVVQILNKGVVQTPNGKIRGFVVTEETGDDLGAAVAKVTAEDFWYFFEKSVRRAALALLALHKNKVFHLNLSTHNYLQTLRGGEFKLANFGHACDSYFTKIAPCTAGESIWNPPEWSGYGDSKKMTAAHGSLDAMSAADGYMFGRTFLSMIALKCISYGNPTKLEIETFHNSMIADISVVRGVLPQASRSQVAIVNALFKLLSGGPITRQADDTLEAIGSTYVS